MATIVGLATESGKEDDMLENKYLKGVRSLCETGITRVPNKYVLPISDRPNTKGGERRIPNNNIKLPVIDVAELQGPNRSQALKGLAKACEEYGFFQVINHGVPCDVIRGMIDVSRRFFELPFEERERYMSTDIWSPVRYGTSFNQNNDGVFCWRDFLKLSCHPLLQSLPHWPSSPTDLRQGTVSYARQIKLLSFLLMKAIVESLGFEGISEPDDNILKELEDGNQMLIINCYPMCPEPDLTLGMPPHSDYGFITLLLQDDVKGLQIQTRGEWVTVEPIPNSFVVNVGDHLEIYSNGKYKSVLHRALVNSSKSRISVASLHSLPYDSVVSPSSKLINKENPRLYRDTDFASFLEYMASCEPKRKNFLESRKLT